MMYVNLLLSHMRFLLLVFICMICFARVSDAQEDSVTYAKTGVNGAYLKSYLTDLGGALTAPLKPTKRRLITYGAAAAGTGVLFLFDDDIKTFSQKHLSDESVWLSENVFEPMGSGKYSVPVMAAAFLGGSVFKNDRLKRVGLLSAKSFILASLIARIPKYAFRRDRPSQTDDQFLWFQGLHHNSFVSGHTTAVFSVASMFAIEYRNTVWVPVLSYSLAAMAGLSRIHDNKHWASDVFAGAMLGYGVARYIYYTNSWGIQITPVVASNFQSVRITYRL